MPCSPLLVTTVSLAKAVSNGVPRREEVPRHRAQRGLDLARQDRIRFGALCDELVDQRLAQRIRLSGLVGGIDIRSPGCSHVTMVRERG